MSEPSEALQKDGVEGWDYVLHPDVDCCWIRINNIAVYLRRQDEGVAVSLYPNGRELDDEICGTWCLYSEAEEDEQQATVENNPGHSGEPLPKVLGTDGTGDTGRSSDRADK